MISGQRHQLEIDFDPYRNKGNGIVGLEKVSGDGTAMTCENYHLFHAHYENLKRLNGVHWTYEDQTRVYEFHKSCQPRPGLLRRFPDFVRDTSQDELVGAARSSWDHKITTSSDILTWGRRHFWCWNTEEPSSWKPRYFFGRHLDLVPFLKMSADEEISKIEQRIWAFWIGLSADSEYSETSGKQWRYIQFKAVKGRYKICDEAIEQWQEKMTKKYPGGLKELFSIYFGNRPFTKWAPTNFDV